MTSLRNPRPRVSAIGLSAVFALALLPITSITPPLTANELSSVGDPVEIALDMVGGRPQVDVYINGEGPYPFVLDTGSSLNVLDSGIASRLGLEVIGGREIGAPGMPQIPADIVAADEITVHGIEVSAGELVTMDLAGLSGGLFLGVLRFSAFEDRLATLDLADAKLVLSSGSLDRATEGVVSFELDDGLIDLPISVAGRSMTAHLDSGSPGSIAIPAALAKGLPFLEKPVEVGQIRLVGGQGAVLEGRLEGDVALGPIQLENPKVTVIDLPVPKVNIGSRLLSQYLVHVDQREGLILFEPKGSVSSTSRPAGTRPSAAPAEGRRLGFKPKSGRPGPTGLLLEDGGLPVEWVEAGSLAEGAGLREGDLILSINDRPMTDFDAASLIALLRSDEPLRMAVRREGHDAEQRIEIR